MIYHGRSASGSTQILFLACKNPPSTGYCFTFDWIKYRILVHGALLLFPGRLLMQYALLSSAFHAKIWKCTNCQNLQQRMYYKYIQLIFSRQQKFNFYFDKYLIKLTLKKCTVLDAHFLPTRVRCF